MSSPEDDEAVSIVLFMGDDCAPCKVVKKHLDRIMQTAGKAGNVSFLMVDTEKHTSLRDKFGIVNVPEVMIDNKTVLTASEASGLLSSASGGDAFSSMMGFGDAAGDMVDAPGVGTFDTTVSSGQGGDFGSMFAGSGAEVFNHLFNALIEARVDREKRDLPANMKNNMLHISSRALRAIDEGETLRSTVGDYVHIGVLQSIVTSMLSINQASKRFLYRAGNMMGRFGALQTKLFEYNPAIFDQFEPTKRFREIVKGLGKMYDATKDQFPTFLASGAKVMRVTDRSAVLRVYGSALAASAADIQTPLCHFFAGDIAGLIENQLGEQVAVRETACWGLGDRYCEFEIKRGETRTFKEAHEDDTMFMSESRSEMFENCLSAISQNTYESTLMRQRLRPGVGDYVHISVLQQILNGLKFSDPFNSTLLYYAGAHYGRLAVDKVVLQSILFETDEPEPYQLPLEFEDGLQVLAAYFNDPRTILRRRQGVVKVRMVDDETAHVRIKECSTACGTHIGETPLVDMQGQIMEEEKIPLCDFTAGFIHGRLDLLLDEDVKVRELECHSTGHNHCLFEVVLD
ncbi:MAG: V4R domain-containing protein [Candidatus Hodarchaeales archaeon]